MALFINRNKLSSHKRHDWILNACCEVKYHSLKELHIVQLLFYDILKKPKYTDVKHIINFQGFSGTG